jgi:hypothetical protein
MKDLFIKFNLKYFEYNENRKKVYIISFDDEYFNLKYELINIEYSIEVDDHQCSIYAEEKDGINTILHIIDLERSDESFIREICKEIENFFEFHPEVLYKRRREYQFRKDDYL